MFGIGLVIADTLLAERVDIRGLDKVSAITREEIMAQLVRHNEDNIGTVHCIFSMKLGTIVMELPTKIGQEAKGGNNGK